MICRTSHPSLRAAGPLLVALALLLPAAWSALPARAEEPTAETIRLVERRGDLVSVFSGDVHVPADVVQRGSVVCIGGTAVVEGRVTQDIVVILGDLELSGSVGGAVTGVLAEMRLRDAQVSREVVSVVSELSLENSQVSRELINVLGSLDRDALSRVAGQVVNIGIGSWAPSLWALVFWIRLFHKFVVFVLLVLLVLLVPERIRAMADEAPVRYVGAFFMGLLAYLALLVVLGLLSFTVVGIPVALFAFYVIKWMGIGAIFLAVGRRLGRSVGVSLSVLGAVLLVFALYVLVMLAPTPLGVGGLLLVGLFKLVFFLLVEMPAVGLVLLTRFGTRAAAPPVGAAPPPGATPPDTPAPPPPAVPPAPGVGS